MGGGLDLLEAVLMLMLMPLMTMALAMITAVQSSIDMQAQGQLMTQCSTMLSPARHRRMKRRRQDPQRAHEMSRPCCQAI